ncbi:MAG: CPBP family intramembrane metalloprotease [Cyclobacteriaceae bacterium]|nr:CPBP family intramembrane metalloprotease [Cyclobacteriaceae bacterium]
MANESNKKSSNWLRLFQFFGIWILANIATYLILVIPFYSETIGISMEEYERMGADDPLFTLLIEVSISVATLISFWFVKQKVEKESIDKFFKWNLRGFSIGSSLGFILILLCSLLMFVFNLVKPEYHSLNNLPFLILVFMLVAVTEEVMFRGYILNNLTEKLSKNLAIILSSLIFAAFHLGNPHFGLIGFINIFLSGILMAIVYLNSKDLWVPIGVHFTWNLTQAVLGFAVSGRNDTGVFKLNYLSRVDYLTGGIFGIEGSLLTTAISLTAISITGKILRQYR